MYSQYEHHGNMVWVRDDLKGTHRESCLCFAPCQNFKPGTADNCVIAQRLYELDVEFGLVTPVYECPEFVESE